MIWKYILVKFLYVCVCKCIYMYVYMCAWAHIYIYFFPYLNNVAVCYKYKIFFG